jgi:hypothetical protein
MPVLNEEMRRIIRDGYAKGLPIKEIAALASTTYDTCRVTASRMGLRHPRRFRPAKGDPIGWTYQKGVTAAEPARSPQYVAWERAKVAASEALKAFQK